MSGAHEQRSAVCSTNEALSVPDMHLPANLEKHLCISNVTHRA